MTTPQLWHASFDRLAVGTILTPRPDYEMRWGSDCAGRILEDARPASMRAHRDAVFACADPQDCDNAGAQCEWLYEIRPEGPVEQHDLAWASEIDKLVGNGWSPDDPAVVALAARYWSGEASPDPVWEYLGASATVLSVEEF